jgi:hypothetical protein
VLLEGEEFGEGVCGCVGIGTLPANRQPYDIADTRFEGV